DETIYNNLILCYARRVDTNVMMKIYNKMMKKSMVPNIHGFQALIYALGVQMKFKSMRKVLQQMYKVAMNYTLLHNLHLIKANIPIKISIFNTMIAAYGSKGYLDDMEEIYIQLTQRKLKPNEITFSALMAAFRK